MKKEIKGFIFSLATLILFFFFSPQAGASPENSCMDCHQNLAPSTRRAHDFSEWKQSIHAQKGITCEQCHGGKPAETDAQKAHEGIIKSNDPKSPLYFTQIPETCGKCHSAELGEFKKSYHYRELKRSGHGPNCLTCHGSMAMTILQPKQLEQSCSLCHEKRAIASEALVTLNLAGSSLKKWEEIFREVKAQGKSTPQEEASLNTQKGIFKELKIKWHSFGLTGIVEQSRKIVTIANQETQALRLKKGAK